MSKDGILFTDRVVNLQVDFAKITSVFSLPSIPTWLGAHKNVIEYDRIFQILDKGSN